MHVAYYVTGHGFGHGVRTAAICNAFSSDVRITIRTTLPEVFFREEVRRPFEYVPAAFDCGCVQNDCMSIDREKTLSTYRSIARKNGSMLPGEVAWCGSAGVDVIASDITPFAFELASRAGIPSVGVSNFTWYDIYKEYLAVVPEYGSDIEEIRSQYGRATLMCALAPALPMSYFPRRKAILPMVGRNGRNLREKIVEKYDFDPAKHLGLIYFGIYGLKEVDFGGLRQFSDWEFIGICDLDSSASNYRRIQKSDFLYQDLVASADVMVCKLGYGAVAECMLHGTPLVYPRRADFAEFPVLDEAARAWGGGYLLSTDEFLSLEWKPVLDSLIAGGRPKPLAQGGARVCADAIERAAGG